VEGRGRGPTYKGGREREGPTSKGDGRAGRKERGTEREGEGILPQSQDE